MQKEINSSVILGFLTFILTAVSLWGLWSMTPISGKYPELELMFCATYGAFIVMLIQILFLLRKPKNNNKRRVQVLLVKNEKEHAWAINSRNID